MMRMVTRGMALCKDLVINFRVSFNIFADTEKSGFSIVFRKDIQDFIRNPGIGPSSKVR